MEMSMKKIIRKLLLFIFILLILAATFIFLIGFGYYSYTLRNKSLTECVEAITSKEHYVSFEQLPENYINAVIAVEDHRYYDHGPVDFIGIARAFYTNIRDGEFDEGGSTITQQVAKNIIFNQDKTLIRKAGEVFGAYDLEKNYTKQEIFALYVNSSYFGDGYYCIYDASMGYFNKEPKDLNLSEASMLAGIPNAPSVYAPTVNPDLAKKRQSHVLNKMVDYGYITQEEADSLK
jgi:membrane peptidoglycan carboxypeptidase